MEINQILNKLKNKQERRTLSRGTVEVLMVMECPEGVELKVLTTEGF